MKKVLSWVDTHIGELVSDLQSLIRQPSISAKNEGIEDCAKLVTKILKLSGIKSEILATLRRATRCKKSRHPLRRPLRVEEGRSRRVGSHGREER